ncbi:MAG: leucyl aminopeptidase [Gammaproteobacteria bacterium]|nr:leucyl aminopeptidase [Gammaproteobacteria bacterium]MCZ6667223.1 leucyl aminopeptidase [Gammaproteobacteria bacterium]
MDFIVKSGNPEKQRTACLIIAVSQPRKLSRAGERIDKASNGLLSTIIRRGDMDGRSGQTLLLHNVPGSLADRVLLVGYGKDKSMNEQAFIKTIETMSTALKNSGASEAHTYLTDIPVKGRNILWKVRATVMQMNNSHYHFDALKSEKSEKGKVLRKLIMNVPGRRDLATGEESILQAVAISAGISMARDLGNLPSNICTPTYIAKQARLLAKGQKLLKVDVLEEADMRKLKMGSLLSVSAGSRQPAKLITLEYKGGKPKDQPVVLVGKGVTFDTGGISIKPGAAMDEMKFDMCGAASVIGTINAVMTMNLPINVVGIIPTTENMPDGLATKPGDIVTSMSGQTIEILNTDAEGRLILCDALSYAEKFKPRFVIDIATLTGACIIALGKIPSAVLGNHQPLVKDLIQSGKQIEDKLWELPLWDEYQEQLNSNFADMANIGGRDAGTITAACFLSRFTKKYKWAHLDIAGTAWKSGDAKGATGRPVPLLCQFIINQVQGRRGQ